MLKHGFVWAFMLTVAAACSATDDPAEGGGAAGPGGTVNGKPKVPCAKEPCTGEQGTANTACKGPADCGSANCKSGVCLAAAPDDGIKNGEETDVDCGGPDMGKCAPDQKCNTGDNCSSLVCKDGTCKAPTADDQVANGSESDVDCGGPVAPKCDAGKKCIEHADCASDACGYDGKCVAVKSCAKHMGGDTCGPGEVGEAGAQHESCCASVPIGGNVNLDKYSITAGRMRTFVERLNGNVRGFVETLGNTGDWKQAWNAQVPTNMEEANWELGPWGNTDDQRQGCGMNGPGARTYWLPDAVNQSYDDIPQKYSKDILDVKALNCATFFMMQALCAWDGGRLATLAELEAQWKGNFPWGNEAWTAERAVHKFTYSFPEDQKDNTAFIGAPGRKPAGNGKQGVADLAGLVFNITSDLTGANVRWSRNGSWENHQIPYGVVNSPQVRGYWAAGGRCVRK